MEMFGYSREMTGHVVQMAGQMQAQAEAQRADTRQLLEAQRADTKQLVEAQRAEARQREEAQRAEVKQREEAQRMEAQAQRAEAMKREKLGVASEQMLAKMKAESDDATRKREQIFMEHELKRQKVCLLYTSPSPRD